MRLEGKLALVTGGTEGIGRGIADLFAEEGATVVIGDVKEPAPPLAPGQGFVPLDVSSPEAWDAAMAAIARDHGRPVDVLVNNAGIVNYKSIEEVSLEEWNRGISVTLTGVLLGMKAVIPGMRAAGGGSIVNISSIWGSVAVAGAAEYHATKGGVRNLTKNAALTHAQDGIRANSIHPGIIRTPLVERQPEDVSAWVVAQTPLGRMGTPREIAYGALYLASDESSYVTGLELYIDGGYTAR